MVRNWRALDGVLLFDKPLGLSSNAALQKVRRLFDAEKAGHTGTLDPMATGLLPVCFGEATKFSTILLDADKTYQAHMKLGQTSSTGDAEGEITITHAVLPDEQQVRAVLQGFAGEIQQTPPMHSALKHQGRPLYEYARKGESVERQARAVTIHELQLDVFAGNEMSITVRCSKGTYVRTLAEDIGRSLGCGAHLLGLRRIAIAGFSMEHAKSLEQLESMDMQQREQCLLPLDVMLQAIPVLDLDDEQARRIAQGQMLDMQLDLPAGLARLYAAGKFIGLGEVQPERKLVAKRLIANAAREAAHPAGI